MFTLAWDLIPAGAMMVTQELWSLSIDECLHPSPKRRFWLAAGIVGPVLLVAATVAFPIIIIAVSLAVLAAWLGTQLMRARLLGHCVQVSADSFPDVDKLLVEIRTQLDYDKHVEAFVYQEGMLNTFLLRRFRSRIILLPHELLVDMLDGRHRQELIWILARSVGHLKARRFRFHWLTALVEMFDKLPVFNLFLYPWERATHYAGDRIGLAVCGDLHAATRVLRKVMLGNALADKASINGLLAQSERLDDSFFGWLTDAFSTQPHPTKRLASLISWAEVWRPELHSAFQDVERNGRKTKLRLRYSNARMPLKF